MRQPGFRMHFARADDGVAEAMGTLAARTITTERAYYDGLWTRLQVRGEWLNTIDRVIDRIFVPARSRYEKVGTSAGKTPWWFIAIVHQLEGSSDFSTHLHNGDPLTRRTVLVPAGRPVAGEPPFTWEESAVDALQLQRLDVQDDWSLAGAAFAFEEYNGFGYRNRGVVSPYLAAQTNLWSKGKFVADGRYDPLAGSSQIGALAFLRRMVDRKVVDLSGQVALPPTEPTERPLLKRGDVSPWVGVLQHTLNGCGYGPLTVDTEFGRATQAELMEFQSDLGLTVDGECGPESWKAIEAHAKVPGWQPLDAARPPLPPETKGTRARVVAQARSWAANGRSHAPGSWIDTNVLDPLRETLIALGHWPKGNEDGFYDWCGAWVCAVLRSAKVDVPDRFSGEWASVALVESWVGWAKRNGAWLPRGSGAPQPGDVVIYDWDGDSFANHIGIVLSVSGDGVESAEGNTRNREVIMQRSSRQIAGYVRLEGLVSRLA